MGKSLGSASLRLATEEAELRTEMALTLAALKNTAVATAKQAGGQVEETAKAHPLLTMGAAAMAGFVAANVAVPRKRRPRSRLAALKEAITGRTAPEPEPPKSSLSGVAFKVAFNLLKPAILSAVASAVQSRTDSKEPAPENGSTNGQDDALDDEPNDDISGGPGGN